MNCPNQDVLQRICRGEVPPAEEQEWLGHIDQCSRCQSAMEHLSGSSDDVKRILGTPEPLDSQLLRDRLSKLKVQRPSPQEGSTHYQDLQPWIDEGDSQIGRVGHYDLIRCIGRGGMGVVFEAFDTQLHRPVALKMMSPSLLTDETNSERFLREARAAAAINHPAVVSIYGVSKNRDLPYLVMELVEGQSLQEKLQDTSPLELDVIVAIATQLAEGLAAAHAQGVVHRDVKPANVLIERDTGNVKLTDFGLAHRTSDNPLTHTGTLLGTPEYLAPEQIDGDPVDHRSDLFSLGSVIFHMCVGDPPFSGPSLVATLRNVSHATPPKLQDLGTPIPTWLSTLVAQLHAKRPEARISEARLVAEVLRARGKNASLSKGVTELSNGEARSRDGGVLQTRGVWMAIVAVAACGIALLGLRPTQGLVATTSDELLELLEEGDNPNPMVIQLASEEPFHLPQLYLEDRDIEFVAKGDFEPIFAFEEPPHEAVIECINSRVVLSGITFRITNEEDDDEEDEEEDLDLDRDDFELGDDFDLDDEIDDAAAAITCEGGELLMEECELEGGSRACVELIQASGALRGTDLCSESRAVIFEGEVSNELRIESCEITSALGVVVTASAPGKLVLSNTQFDCETAIELHYEEETAVSHAIQADSNRFDTDEAVIAVYHANSSLAPESTGQLPFRWIGSENEVFGRGVTLLQEFDGQAPTKVPFQLD